MDFIGKFLNTIVKAGIIPHSTNNTFSPTDRFRRLRAEHDKPSKRSISYWLKIEHDFAYGYARDFKTGLECHFRSHSNDPSLTRADISRIKTMLKARQLQEDIRTAERHQKIAARAAQKWATCTRHGTTPYLTRKNIPSPLSAGIYGQDQLLVPIYDGPDLVSWQIIYPDGEKRFPFGGKKKGCYHIIGGPIPPRVPLIICEGFATGATLHQTLGIPIIVAFDAGNLLPVAKALHKAFPDQSIIIASDNDPPPHLTGQKAALQVQRALPNVSIVTPPNEGTDFNDLHDHPGRIRALFGFEAETDGGDSLSGSGSQSPAPVRQRPPDEHDWQAKLSLDGKNRLEATSLKNAALYLLYHHDYRGVFAYDEFKQETMLLKCPPFEHEEKFIPKSLTDIIITKTTCSLEDYGIKSTIDKTARAIEVVAGENSFHSAREYLSTLEWDGVDRLSTFAQEYFGTTQESPEYLSFVFKKWITASVKRVFEPGCKFDHVLILESQQQGLYKSTFLKEMATFNGECYHTDSVTINDLDNKDSVMKMQGNLIVELAELSGMNKKEDNQIKNWLTQTQDEIRIPFERKVKKYPRQFVFAATTNNYDYLRDPTGNRRYWPVTVEKAIETEKIREIKSQLWAQAVHNYKEGLYIGPTPEENELAEKERGKRLQEDAWEDIVQQAIQKIGLDQFRTNDIINAMELRTTDKNEKAVRRVSSVLKSLGYENKPTWDGVFNKTVRTWIKK